MFTGLISATGRVSAVARVPNGMQWSIESSQLVSELRPGDSVSVSGSCHTVEWLEGETFSGTSIKETLQATTFGGWTVGQSVNLELPLCPSDRIGGHFVTGHVDGTGEVHEVQRSPDGHRIVIGFDPQFDWWVLSKGSIAIDGVSLTVMEKSEGRIMVSLIPETLARTTLGQLRVGDRTNLEFDMLVKAAVQAAIPNPAVERGW